jgi:hypothetical protein
MKITVYPCSDPYIQAKTPELLEISREAFDDFQDEAVLSRLGKYPEIAIAEDEEGIAGFIFPTPHACGRNRMVGLRFLTIGNRCRNKKLSTLLTGVVLVRAYRNYLIERIQPDGPNQLFVISRICNPKAYYTLTKGNAGVSPEMGLKDPTALVAERKEIYAWMVSEFGLDQFDQRTGIVIDGAVGAGIIPRNTRVHGPDQEDWERYVPEGSEVMMLMTLDWKYFLNNAMRVVRLLKPKRLRKY